MATEDAEIIEPPDPIEAEHVATEAEVVNDTQSAATPRVSIESRAGIVRRSVR